MVALVLPPPPNQQILGLQHCAFPGEAADTTLVEVTRQLKCFGRRRGATPKQPPGGGGRSFARAGQAWLVACRSCSSAPSERPDPDLFKEVRPLQRGTTSSKSLEPAVATPFGLCPRRRASRAWRSPPRRAVGETKADADRTQAVPFLPDRSRPRCT
eukprot:gene1690-biopygen15396